MILVTNVLGGLVLEVHNRPHESAHTSEEEESGVLASVARLRDPADLQKW